MSASIHLVARPLAPRTHTTLTPTNVNAYPRTTTSYSTTLRRAIRLFIHLSFTARFDPSLTLLQNSGVLYSSLLSLAHSPVATVDQW